MKYNDNGTYKDIYVKTFDTLPIGAELDYDGERVPSGYVQVEAYKILGTTTNSNETITLTNDKLSNYKFICVTAGYYPNETIITIPISVFSFSTSRKYRLHVKTYDSYGYVNVQYVNDTQFLINGAVEELPTGRVGTDVETRVFGIY